MTSCYKFIIPKIIKSKKRNPTFFISQADK